MGPGSESTHSAGYTPMTSTPTPKKWYLGTGGGVGGFKIETSLGDIFVSHDDGFTKGETSEFTYRGLLRE